MVRSAQSAAAKRGEETLLIEWPVGEPEPTKYWLATVEKNISFRALVDLAKMGRRVERDYLELKQEVGLGHYEGRRWPTPNTGTFCIAVYGFMISEREMIPPSGPHCAGKLKNLPFPIVTDPAAPPIRPERHVPNSIATLHQYLIVAIARTSKMSILREREFKRNRHRVY